MEKYELQRLLSSSETADVHQCSVPKNTVIKIFKKDSAFRMELKSLQHLDKIPNVVQMKDFIDEDPTKAIALEFAQRGTLFSYVAKSNGLSEEEAHFFFVQIVRVIELLHQKGIAHRDIKLENILLDENFTALLCDFGNAIFLSNIDDLGFIPSAGTQGCRAPELLHPLDIVQSTIDLKKADIFSLGVLLFTMVFCKQPFTKADTADFFFQTLTKSKSKFWNLFANEPSPHFKDLINSLINPNPSERLSIPEILNHPWILSTLSTCNILNKSNQQME